MKQTKRGLDRESTWPLIRRLRNSGTELDEMRETTPNPSTRASKRLLFDRRYGWVIDDYKEPSEEALAGGRGMFCILPLATALLKTASHSINVAASSAVKVLERPDLFSPQALQASLGNELRIVKSFLTSSDIGSLFHKGKDSSVQMENSE